MKAEQKSWNAGGTLTLLLLFLTLPAKAQVVQDPPFGRPDAVVDLASRDGVQLLKGQWRYHDVKIVDADSRAVGPDLKPSGDPIKTYDYAPHAGAADFDDSRWEAIDATTLDQRRSTAKVCFNWYRINVTIPEKVANFETAGSTVAFEIVIDDYAEVWVNGKMPRVLGQPGGPVIKGFNAPNRVIITRNAQPGQRIHLLSSELTDQSRTARKISSGSNRRHWISTRHRKLQSAKRRRKSSEKILRSMRSFQPARRSRNSPEDFYSPKARSGFHARKTRTATFSLAIPTTISFTAGRKTANCRSS